MFRTFKENALLLEEVYRSNADSILKVLRKDSLELGTEYDVPPEALEEFLTEHRELYESDLSERQHFMEQYDYGQGRPELIKKKDIPKGVSRGVTLTTIIVVHPRLYEIVRRFIKKPIPAAAVAGLGGGVISSGIKDGVRRALGKWHNHEMVNYLGYEEMLEYYDALDDLIERSAHEWAEEMNASEDKVNITQFE